MTDSEKGYSEMDIELRKFRIVNQCNSLEELANTIEMFADKDGMIEGRTKKFDAEKMADYCRYPLEGLVLHPRCLTRNYGIRQQAIYLDRLERYGKAN